MSSQLFDADAEAYLLSIILNNPEQIIDLNNLRSFMFSSKPNSGIYKIIEDINSEGSLPDVHLVELKLAENGNLDRFGGSDYLNYLIRLDIDVSNIKEYEMMVLNNYKARSLLAIGSSIPASVTNSSEIDSAIARIRTSLDNLAVTSGGDSTIAISDAVEDVYKTIETRTHHPGTQGWTTGLNNIDTITSGLNPGDLWFFGGRPGMAKTAIICNMALAQAKKGIGSLTFSLEMNKNLMIERLYALETGIWLMPNIRMGMMTDKELALLKNAIEVLKPLPIYIDTNFNISLEYVESTIRKYKRTRDINIVYLDYVQLLAERDDDATNALGRISRKAKLLANELGIAIVINSQLNRGVESRDDKRPMMSDLRQSGNLEEDADLMSALYRDDYYNKDTKFKGVLEFIIRKQRTGPTGTVLLNFEAETNIITDRT